MKRSDLLRKLYEDSDGGKWYSDEEMARSICPRSRGVRCDDCWLWNYFPHWNRGGGCDMDAYLQEELELGGEV